MRGAALLLLCLLGPGLAGKPRAPVAVEARFKERLTAKLQDALAAAVGHLAWVLGVSGARGAGAEPPSAFGRYELELAGGGHWRTRCEADIDTRRDSITLCVMHKLQALTALCNVEGAAKEHRAGIMALLKPLLGRRDKVVKGLGIKRSFLPVAQHLEGWLYETAPGSGEYDMNMAVHAAAMLTLVQCGQALGEKDLFSDIQMWFRTVEQVYPKKLWDKATFHSSSILWESFVLISSAVHRESSLAEGIVGFLGDFESFLLKAFMDDPKAWSFSGAHAAVLSWAGERRPARRRRLGRVVDEYLRRWRDLLAPAINASEAYTCGPLQGVAPLLTRRGPDAAELVSSVLRLAEKDVDLFQLRAASAASAASLTALRLGPELLAAQGPRLEGAFLRDEGQLRREGRRTLRLDDTAQCVLGLVRTLRLLDDLAGVEVPEAEAGTPGAEGAEGAAARPGVGATELGGEL